MANEFYTPSNSPATSSTLSSATMRAEFAAIASGLDKLPTLAGNNSKLVIVNAGATGMQATTSVAGITLTSSAFNGTVGATTPSTGAFTTLSASGTVSGAGFTALMASPGPIGSTTPSTGAFTTLSASSQVVVTGSGFSPVANSSLIRNVTGQAQWWANGPDVSTSGNHLFVVARSDGTNSTSVAQITSTGLAVTGALSATGNAAIGGTVDKVTGLSGSGTGLTVQASAAPTIAVWDTSDASWYSSFGQISSDAYLYNQSSTGSVLFGTNNTERMRLDTSGNLGLGVTPSAWGAPALQLPNGVGLFSYASTPTMNLGQNVYAAAASGTNRYIATAAASLYQQQAGAHYWLSAPSGTAGNPISFTQAMTLDASGNLGLGVTPSANGSIYYKSFELGKAGCGLFAATASLTGSELTYFAGNAVLTYSAGPLWSYGNNGGAATYGIEDGIHIWRTAPSGTAGNAITFTQAMTLDASGFLGVGMTPNLTQLEIKQSATYGIGLHNSNSTQNYSWRVEAGAGSPLILGSRTTSTDLMWLSSTGNLGLGVTPSAKLDVSLNSGGTVMSIATTTQTPSIGGGGQGIRFGWNGSTNGPTIRLLHGGSYNEAGLIFSTWSSATETERMRLDSSGNLGLGVTPKTWSAGKAFEIGASGNGIWSYAGVNRLTQNAYFNTAWIYAATDAAALYEQVTGTHIWKTAPSGTAGNAISFTQAMTLDASGNLGLGITSPAAAGTSLHINGSTDASLRFTNSSSGTTVSDGFKLQINGSDAYLVNYENGFMSFYTNSQERARIDSSGNLLVGTTTTRARVTVEANSLLTAVPYDSNDTRNDATSSASFYFRRLGTIVGSIATTTTATTYNTTSDHRLKENVRPADAARFMDIEFVDFEWTDGRHDCGVIAHQLASVYPDLVIGEKDATEVRTVEITPAVPEVKDEDGNVITPAIPAVTEEQTFPVYQQVNYIGLIGRMGTRIQSLQRTVDAQAEMLAALEARIAALEAK